mgnify:CR=1 FL=1
MRDAGFLALGLLLLPVMLLFGGLKACFGWPQDTYHAVTNGACGPAGVALIVHPAYGRINDPDMCYPSEYAAGRDVDRNGRLQSLPPCQLKCFTLRD